MDKNEDKGFELSVKVWVPNVNVALPQTDLFLSHNKLLPIQAIVAGCR